MRVQLGYAEAALQSTRSRAGPPPAVPPPPAFEPEPARPPPAYTGPGEPAPLPAGQKALLAGPAAELDALRRLAAAAEGRVETYERALFASEEACARLQGAAERAVAMPHSDTRGDDDARAAEAEAEAEAVMTDAEIMTAEAEAEGLRLQVAQAEEAAVDAATALQEAVERAEAAELHATSLEVELQSSKEKHTSTMRAEARVNAAALRQAQQRFDSELTAAVAADQAAVVQVSRRDDGHEEEAAGRRLAELEQRYTELLGEQSAAMLAMETEADAEKQVFQRELAEARKQIEELAAQVGSILAPSDTQRPIGGQLGGLSPIGKGTAPGPGAGDGLAKRLSLDPASDSRPTYASGYGQFDALQTTVLSGMDHELALSRQQARREREDHAASLRHAGEELEAALTRAEQAEFMLTTISRAVIAAPD